MKKCLIMLTALIVTLIVAIFVESKDVDISESTIAINIVEDQYSALKE